MLTYHCGSAGLAIDGLQAHVLHPQLHLAMPFALQVHMRKILSIHAFIRFAHDSARHIVVPACSAQYALDSVHCSPSAYGMVPST